MSVSYGNTQLHLTIWIKINFQERQSKLKNVLLRKAINIISYYYLTDEVKTTLVLNVNQGGQNQPTKNGSYYDATIFESLKESSVFYQRPVDDILLLDASNG